MECSNEILERNVPNIADNLLFALSRFREVTPGLLKRCKLLRRVDSKFLAAKHQLDVILPQLTDDYAAMHVPTGCVATYQNLYLDSPSLVCFHDHRRGRRIRRKVRYRHYPDRGLSFLEVKTKKNEFVTKKDRREVAYKCESLKAGDQEFLFQRFGSVAGTLFPVARISYNRISLVGIHTDERVTIDFNLEVATPQGPHCSLGEIVIVEVKQSHLSTGTPIMRTVKSAGLKQGTQCIDGPATELSIGHSVAFDVANMRAKELSGWLKSKPMVRGIGQVPRSDVFRESWRN